MAYTLEKSLNSNHFFHKKHLMYFKGYIDQLELIQVPKFKEQTYIMEQRIEDVWNMKKI
jgi:hypothetical protein